MTKEQAIALGVASQAAKDIFYNLSLQNTKIDPTERAVQIAQYEAARADMHEAMNRHHAALTELGMLKN